MVYYGLDLVVELESTCRLLKDISGSDAPCCESYFVQ